MKKILIITGLVVFGFMAHAQTSILTFCTYVDNDTHQCIFQNNKFITSPDSTRARLFMLLRSREVFGTEKLTFKVYGIDRFNVEVFLFDIVEEVKSDWMSAWQPAMFTSPGKYMIKVYKDADTMITSAGFEFYNL